MFPLRPGNDEPAFEDDDVQPELDRDILERLSAYAPEEPADSEESEEAEPLVAELFVETGDRAVEDGHVAEQAASAEHEPDEPGEEESTPGSDELHVPELELPEPAVLEARTREPGGPEPGVFSVGSSAHDRDETDLREFALPEADFEESSLFEAELSAFDFEAESEPETEPVPTFTYSFEVGSSRDDAESRSIEPVEDELPEPAAFEATSDAEADVVDDEAADAGLPGSEIAEPDRLVAGEVDAIPDVSEALGAEAALVEAGVSEGEEPETSGRRSFRRRGAPHGEKKNRKERAPKEKRGSKDKKSKRLVGLKIGASQIAAAQVVNNGAPELVEVFREPLDPGLVVSGEIRDPEALGAALKRLFELHKLPKRGVRLGISNNRIGVRIFEIEGVSDTQQLDNAIRFRAEEVLPIPLDQAVLDYVVLEDAVREDGTSWKRILLVVAYREVVDRYLQACHSAGLEVVGIDLEAFALLRAIEAPMDRGHHAGALVAVAIGHDRTTIAVSTGRYCEFTRVLDWGGWSLNVAIARELDRAPSEVEAIKRQLSFATSTEVDDLTPEQAAKAREAIQRSLSGFVRELVASLQFYQAQPGALGIGEVVLTGGAAHMDGLPEALGELVGVPIRLGDPFKRVKVGAKVSHEGPRGSLAVAIGLGIED